MICNYLFSCFFGILACFVAGNVASEAIIGGILASENQFPYHVSVQIENRNECGGGIIGERFILTAAHCLVDNWEPHELVNKLSIVAGTNNLYHIGASGLRILVERAYYPKEYDRMASITIGDIAILKLKEPLKLSVHGFFYKVKLPKNQHDNYSDKEAKIAGFGWTWVHEINSHMIGNNSNGQLVFARTDVIDCVHYLASEKHICAKVRQPSELAVAGTCPGDSGSLLVDNHGIAIGILSVGPKSCVERHHAAIYTRISHYLTFIRNAKEGKVTKTMWEIVTSD